MMRRGVTGFAVLAVVVIAVAAAAGYWAGRRSTPQAPAAAESAARGAQLVELGGCDNCHTPKLPDGSLDMSRRLSGYQEGVSPLPPAVAPGQVSANPDFTSFRGDWGVSKARNLTPDATGIGGWSETQFIQTLKTGVDPSGMKLMPPMPIMELENAPEADLAAIYNYLRTLKPVANKITGM